MQWRKRPKALSAVVAATALVAAFGPLSKSVNAAVDTIWIGHGSSPSWTNPANWDQVTVPNGFNDVARFTSASGGPIVDLSNASIQLSQLDFSDPLFAAISGNGTINLVNNAIIQASGNNFDLPEKVYASFGTTDPANPRPGNNLSIAMVGTVGLNKTGDSHLQIDAPQYYTGTTTIGGGKIISTIGDSAFGSAANPIFLSNGSLQISNNIWNTNRTIYVGAGTTDEASNGSIFWVNGTGTLSGVNFYGDVAGIGSMQLNGFYTSAVGTLSAGSAVFHTENSFSGTLNITGGTVALSDSGALLGIGSVIIDDNPPIYHPILNGGTLVLDNSNSGANLNRINDYTPLHMRGAALTAVGGNTRYEEGIGSLVLEGGVSYITVNAGAGGASVGFSGLDRHDIYNAGSTFFGAGLVFRGNNLGGTPGANTANIYIGSGTLLLDHGLLPFAYVNANYTPGSTPESVDNVLASYDAAVGVKPVLVYDPDFANNNPSNNVRISSNLAIGAGTVNANALVLTAPATLVSASGQGMTLSGAGTIQLASGVILSANAGSTGTLGTINSIPGNIISSNLNFGTQMASILTPSALSITGAIYGAGGLTKLGGRTLVLYSGNKYTGRTYLTGFTRFVGNVWADGFTPNPFGLDLSPIIVYGGNASPVNPISGAYNGTGYGQLGSDSPGTTNFNRELELRGDRILLRSFGDGTLLWNGTITLMDPQTSLTFLSSKSTAHQVVNGPIFGPVLLGDKLPDGETDRRGGQVVIGSSDGDPNSPTWVDLRNEGVFNGGLVLAGGTLGIGHDRALGGQTLSNGAWMAGTVQISGNTLITAIDGPRIIDNRFVNYGNTLGIGGSNTITLTGTIDGRGGDYIANITSTVPTTITGTLTGGGIVKTGSGTLVLSGNNLFTGVLAVGNGTTSGGVLVLQSSNATGSTLGATGVDYGTFTSSGTIIAGQQNQLILDSTGVAAILNFPAELLYLRGFGIGNTGAVRNIMGNNTWGGTVRVTPTYRNAGTATASLVSQTAGIGVDANTALTLSSGILADDDPGVSNGSGTLFLATSQGLRKVGGGTLLVGSQPLASGSGIWNSAINLTGSLEIQAGTVVAKSHTGVGSIAGGRSVIDVASISLGSTSSPVGRLDLTDNALVVNYTGTSPILNIRNYLKAGYTSSGVWGGNGITSSTATPIIYTAGKITLGYADTHDFPMSNIFGDPLDSTSIVVRSAYAGDANFDGKVDVADFTILALHWQQFSTFWTTGDFNYDGVCNINDLALLGLNWQQGVANPMSSNAFSSLLASFGLPEVSVPEPTATFTFLSVIGLTTLRRRQRSSARRQ